VARAAQTTAEILTLAEAFVTALGDHHVFINTNSDASPRLAPSGLEVWAELVDGQPMLTQVRTHSAAWRAGLRAGMTIKAIDGASPLSGFPAGSPVWAGFVLRHKLAGRQNHDALVDVVNVSGAGLQVRLTPPPDSPAEPLTFSMSPDRVAYIVINNRLFDPALVEAFDKVMAAAASARAIILDLRNTPSGGDSIVAKPIMAWFVRGERGYQIHETASRRWTETVIGRPDGFTGKLFVLVNAWTGSMGEGLAIGLRSAAGARLIGAPMAGLRGAMGSVRLECLGADLRIPVERLYAMDGTPRERAAPDIVVSIAEQGGAIYDAVLARGLALARGA
jgi:carboxyl-terminal processing protease